MKLAKRLLAEIVLATLIALVVVWSFGPFRTGHKRIYNVVMDGQPMTCFRYEVEKVATPTFSTQGKENISLSVNTRYRVTLYDSGPFADPIAEMICTNYSVTSRVIPRK